MENQWNHYVIYYKDAAVAHFHTYEDGTYAYGPNLGLSEETHEELKALGLGEARKGRRPPKALSALMAKKQRVPERKRVIYQDGPLKMERKPASIPAGSFSVYDRRARKGAPDYSELPHDAPHYEGPNTPEGMRE